MRCPLIVSLGLVTFLALSNTATAQPKPKLSDPEAGNPQMMEILRKADAATKAVTSVSYRAEYYGSGDMASRLSRVSGTVKAKKTRRSLLGRITGSTPKEMFAIEAVENLPGSEKGIAFKVASNGEKICRIDEIEKTYRYGALSEARQMAFPADRLLMVEFIYPTPFSDEINGKSVRYEGKKKIGDVECHVLYIVYANDSESRWFFGTEDYLPRRVDRIYNPKLGKGATVLVITDLNTQPTLPKEVFEPARPEGYQRKKYAAPQYPEPPPLLTVGSKAPDWELKSADGKTVTLKSLRGNIVVLDFWATWCGPCKAAMPSVQKLHEKYRDQPVKVFGVNCWESGNPAEYMKERKFTYGLLLKADRMAEDYQVRGIPTFYVIDAEGKILYASMGFSNEADQKIATIIDRALLKKANHNHAKEGRQDEKEDDEETSD